MANSRHLRNITKAIGILGLVFISGVCVALDTEEKITPGPASLVPFNPTEKIDAPLNIRIGTVNISAFPEIEIYASVWGEDQANIEGLNASHFTLTEQGPLDSTPVEQTIAVSAGQGAGGIVTCLVMDRSGSMSGQEMTDAKESAKGFVDNLSSGDRVGLISFSSRSSIHVDQSFVFADEVGKNKLRNAIDTLNATGSTALYDAIIEGVTLTAEEIGGKAVIAFTDGQENDSGSNINEVIENANLSGVQVYTIGIGSSSSESNLTNIANQTGGEFFYAPSASELLDLYNLIEKQISLQYVITYRTHNSVQDNTERLVEVTVASGADQASDTATYVAGLAPQIELTPETTRLSSASQPENQDIIISANIFNYEPITAARLFYRVAMLKNTYAQVAMTHIQDTLWSATIPGDQVFSPGIEYYITASDGIRSASSPPLDPQAYPYHIAVMPNEAPALVHVPVTYAQLGTDVLISAVVTDTTDYVGSVLLFYRSSQTPTYLSVDMQNVQDNTYEAIIPQEFLTGAGCDYYLLATDNFGVASYHGTSSAPHRINYGASEVYVSAAYSEDQQMLVVHAWAYDAMQGIPVKHGTGYFTIYDRNLSVAAAGSMKYDTSTQEWISGAIQHFLPGEYVVEVKINGMIGTQSFTAGPLYVEISGTVYSSDDGSSVSNAEIRLYNALNETLVDSVFTRNDGSYVIPFINGVTVGWYYLQASIDTQAGITLCFFADNAYIDKDIWISENEALGLLSNITSISEGIINIAEKENEMLSDMSKSVDRYLNDYDALDVALKIINVGLTVHGIYDAYHTIPNDIDSIKDLIRISQDYPDLLSYTTQATGWAVSLADLGLNFYSIADPILNFDEELKYWGLFLSPEFGGVSYGPAGLWPWESGNHYCTPSDFNFDPLSLWLGDTLQFGSDNLRSYFLSSGNTLGFSVDAAMAYLDTKLMEIQGWLNTDDRRSQIIFYSPESGGKGETVLALRPTYLRYHKDRATADTILAGKWINTGVKVASAAGVICTGPVSGVVGAAATTAIDVGLDIAEAHVKADLAQTWSKSGSDRMRDFIQLANYSAQTAEFLEVEDDLPKYLSNIDLFSASIDEVSHSFPATGLFGLPSTGSVEVEVTVTNTGNPSSVAVRVGNYANETFSSLFQALNPITLPIVLGNFFTGNIKMRSLTDVSMQYLSNNMSSGTSESLKCELVTGVGLLENLFDQQILEVTVYNGPWITGSKVIKYNLVSSESKSSTSKTEMSSSKNIRTARENLTIKEAADYCQRVLAEHEITLNASHMSETIDIDTSADASSISILVNHSDQSDFSLLVTNADGNRIGFDGLNGTRYAEFPGVYSGPQANPEQIDIPNCASQSYSATINLARSVRHQDETATLLIFEEPVRPAILAFAPETIEKNLTNGKRIILNTQVAEVGGQLPLENLEVQISEIKNSKGDILRLNAEQTPAKVKHNRVMGGLHAGVSFEYLFLEDQPYGEYTGEISISTANAGELKQPVKVVYGEPAFLVVDTNSISLTKAEPAGTFSVTNIGNLELQWTADSEDSSVINVTPSSGSGEATVTVNTTDFSEDRTVIVTIANTLDPENSETVEVNIEKYIEPEETGCGCRGNNKNESNLPNSGDILVTGLLLAVFLAWPRSKQEVH